MIFCYILQKRGIEMIHLVMKDFYVNRKYLLIAVLYLGFALFLTDNLAPTLIFALAISYGTVTRSCYNDDKDRGGIFLRALPIRASTVVLSKYLLGLTMILMNVLAFVLHSVIRGQGLETDYGNIMVIIFTLSLVYSVYLPVFFKCGYMKATSFQTIFFIGILVISFGFRALVDFMKSSNPAGGQWLAQRVLNLAEMLPKDSTTLLILLCSVALVILTISAAISLKIYNDSSV